MVFDWDDYWPGHTDDGRLAHLKELRPDFKCTLFAPPGRAPLDFWEAVPDWCQLAVHGWMHPDPYECADWTVDDIAFCMWQTPSRFVKGFKAPGWQISDACYTGLKGQHWWVADHPENNQRRPRGIRAHVLNVVPDHWHGHIGNDCGNGIEETWDTVVRLVEAAESFEFVSERVAPWLPDQVPA